MRAGMQDQKWQLELIGANEFLGQSANRIGVKLRIGRREVDQVIRMRENGRRARPAVDDSGMR